jgi:hypothetical protein
MSPPEHNLDGHPEIFVVGNATREDGTPLGLRGAGMGFHTDGEDKTVPNDGSFRYARRVPPEGGDTLFADMYGVYEALPRKVRGRIAGRRARFSRAALHHINYPHLPMPPALRDRPDVWHPLERRHPKSGRVALYIGRWAATSKACRRPRGARWSPSCRSSRGSRALSTGTAGARATRCYGTIAAPSIARLRSTRTAMSGSCTARPWKAKRR